MLQPLDARQVKSVETTRKKAKTLFADGYECQATADALVFRVIAPERTIKKTNTVVRDSYTVDLNVNTCTCPLFTGCDICKHLIATHERVSEALKTLGMRGLQGLRGEMSVTRVSEFEETSRAYSSKQTPQTPHNPQIEETPIVVPDRSPHKPCHVCGRVMTNVCTWCLAHPPAAAVAPAPPPVPARTVKPTLRQSCYWCGTCGDLVADLADVREGRANLTCACGTTAYPVIPVAAEFARPAAPQLTPTPRRLNPAADFG